MTRRALTHARRARGNAVSQELVSKYTKTCWKKYPKVTKKAGSTILSVVTFGAHGVTRNKRRNDCLAAAKKGRPDPRGAQDRAKKRMGKPYQMWAVKEPWNGRPKDVGGNIARVVGLKSGGDSLRSVAEGRKPWGSKYIDLERKATILGGIAALQAIGASTAWDVANVSGIQLKLSKDPTGPKLLKIVQDAAREKGLPIPKSLRDASELVRKEVISYEVGGPAWYARAMHLALAGTKATAKRGQVEGVVSMGTGLAGQGLISAGGATSATVIGAPVGVIMAGAGAVLQGVSVGFAALKGRTKVEEARALGAAQGFAQKFQSSLVDWNLRMQQEMLDAQMEQLEREKKKEEREAQLLGERISTVLTYAVVASAVGGSAYLTYLAVQKWKEKR